jgi:hypothetical protein
MLLDVKIRHSSVGTAAGFEMDGLCSVPVSIVSRTAMGPTQPPIQSVPRALSPEIKRLDHEADSSPPSSAKMVELYLHSPIRFHGLVLN